MSSGGCEHLVQRGATCDTATLRIGTRTNIQDLTMGTLT